MKKIADFLRTTELESSSLITDEFKAFVKFFQAEFKKELTRIGCTNFTFIRGHFDISGFFQHGTQLYYFSLGDVRGSTYRDAVSMMYRTAEHRQDWKGGSNQWVQVGEGMAEQMFLRGK